MDDATIADVAQAVVMTAGILYLGWVTWSLCSLWKASGLAVENSRLISDMRADVATDDVAGDTTDGRGDILKLQNEVELLNAEAAAYQENMAGEMASLESEVEALNAEADAYQATIKELDGLLSNAKTDYEILMETFEKMSDAVDDSAEKLTELAEVVLIQEEKIKDRDEAITHLEHDCRIEELVARCNQEGADGLKARLERVLAELAVSEDGREYSDAEVGILRKQNESLTAALRRMGSLVGDGSAWLGQFDEEESSSEETSTSSPESESSESSESSSSAPINPVEESFSESSKNMGEMAQDQALEARRAEERRKYGF